MCSSAPSLYFVSLFLFLLLLFLLVKLPEEVAIAQGLLFSLPSPPLPSLPSSLPSLTMYCQLLVRKDMLLILRPNRD